MDASTLGHIGLFEDLTQEHLDVLARNLRPLHMDAGEMLITESSETRAPLLVVTDGILEVTRRDADGTSHTITKLEPPTVVGELEFLANVPASASVKAVSEVSGVLLPRARFQALFDEGQPAAYALALSIGRILSQRLADTNHLLIKALAGQPERMRAVEQAQFDAKALANIDAELDALLDT